MKLAEKVCSYAQAVRLSQLGLANAPATFYYHPANPFHPEGPHLQQSTSSIPFEASYAYGPAELGELLPSSVYASEVSYDLTLSKNDQGGGWVASYDQYEPRDSHGVFEGKAVYEETQAQAMATMLIWLLESSHHTAAEACEALKA